VTTPHVEYLAHHMFLLAVPAFLPAIVVVAVVVYVALRDRRTGRRDQPHQPTDASDDARD
jgi:hypothetical protein